MNRKKAKLKDKLQRIEIYIFTVVGAQHMSTKIQSIAVNVIDVFKILIIIVFGLIIALVL